jgi:hypothetical protein
MHCTTLLLAHVISYTLDHMEPELEEPMEQAQVEDLTKLAWIKVHPSASNHAPCLLI